MSDMPRFAPFTTPLKVSGASRPRLCLAALGNWFSGVFFQKPVGKTERAARFVTNSHRMETGNSQFSTLECPKLQERRLIAYCNLCNCNFVYVFFMILIDILVILHPAYQLNWQNRFNKIKTFGNDSKARNECVSVPSMISAPKSILQNPLFHSPFRILVLIFNFSLINFVLYFPVVWQPYQATSLWRRK